jgi:general secretion pathway protein G
MVILGLLASQDGHQVMKQLGSSKVKTAQLQIDEYSSALDLMRLEVGRYPTSEEGLNALIENPGSMMGWAGPYLRKSVIRLDPWGQDYHYRYPGQHGEFDIYSLGADNVDGGEKENKDVASWN